MNCFGVGLEKQTRRSAFGGWERRIVSWLYLSKYGYEGTKYAYFWEFVQKESDTAATMESI